MKILIISDAWYPQINGVVRTYEHLCEALEKRGHQTLVIGPTDFRFKVPLPGYAEIKVPLFPNKHLRNLIDTFEPDHIHVATEGRLGAAAKNYCKKYDRKYTTCYHTHFPDYVAKRFGKYLPFLYAPVFELCKRFIRKFHKNSAAVFVVSQSLKDLLKGWSFSAPMAHLTRGVDFEHFNFLPSSVLRDVKKPIALYVGRIAIEKNLEAFLDLDWSGTKVLVGGGPDLNDLQRRYPDVRFVGPKAKEDLASYYNAADLFVFPSKTDTFGLVLIEALACGLPVAAYPVTGPIDIVTDKKLGVLNDDLGKAVREVLALNDKAQQEDLQVYRRRYVQENFTWAQAALQFEDTILKVENA